MTHNILLANDTEFCGFRANFQSEHYNLVWTLSISDDKSLLLLLPKNSDLHVMRFVTNEKYCYNCDMH